MPDTAGLEPWDAALLAALERPLEGTPGLLTLGELAARSGMPPAVLEALAREGLLLARSAEGEPRYHPDDAEAVRAGMELVEAGLPLAELLDLARRMDRAMRPVADAAVEVFARFVRDSVEASARDDDEAAARLVEAFRTMLPATGRLVDHHFRALLVAGARSRLAAGDAS
jgi:DNA-binding transcriptional MerR regulator